MSQTCPKCGHAEVETDERPESLGTGLLAPPKGTRGPNTSSRLRANVVVFLCPPVFYARRKKWGAFVINGFFYAVGLLYAMAGARTDEPLVGILFGVLFWLFCLAGIPHTRWHEKAQARPAPSLRSRILEGVLIAGLGAAMLLMVARVGGQVDRICVKGKITSDDAIRLAEAHPDWPLRPVEEDRVLNRECSELLRGLTGRDLHLTRILRN